MTKLDRVGTLVLYDTGVCCSTRAVKILRIECTGPCHGVQVGIEAVVTAVWKLSKEVSGHHNGCDRPGWELNPQAEPLRACPGCGDPACAGTAAAV